MRECMPNRQEREESNFMVVLLCSQLLICNLIEYWVKELEVLRFVIWDRYKTFKINQIIEKCFLNVNQTAPKGLN